MGLFQGKRLACWGLTCTHRGTSAVSQHCSSCKQEADVLSVNWCNQVHGDLVPTLFLGLGQQPLIVKSLLRVDGEPPEVLGCCGKRMTCWGLACTNGIAGAVSRHCSSCKQEADVLSVSSDNPVCKGLAPTLFLLDS